MRISTPVALQVLAYVALNSSAYPHRSSLYRTLPGAWRQHSLWIWLHECWRTRLFTCYLYHGWELV